MYCVVSFSLKVVNIKVNKSALCIYLYIVALYVDTLPFDTYIYEFVESI